MLMFLSEGKSQRFTETAYTDSAYLENINKLIENIKEGYNFKFVDEPKEDGENIIFKIKTVSMEKNVF